MAKKDNTDTKTVLCEKYCAKSDSFAIVQEENDCVYLYFYIRPGSESQEIRACWVRNYVQSADAVDKKAMDAGMQPKMPARATLHPQGSARLNPDKIGITFLDDCDGVAMFYDGKLAAVIPGWASSDEFPGYAADAVGTSSFAWELGDPSTNAIFEHVERSEKLWSAFEKENLWETYRDKMLSAFESKYGKHTKYYAIDAGNFPPKALVAIERGDVVCLFTIGVSLLAQPTVGQFTDDEEKYRRFELAFAVDKAIFEKNEDQFLKFISGASDIPWGYMTFLADGHTLLFDIDFKANETFTNVVLLDGETTFGQKLTEPFMDDKVNLLWVVPITQKQQDFAEQNGHAPFLKKAIALREEAFRIFDGTTKFSI